MEDQKNANKKKKWPFIVGGIIVVLLIMAYIYAFVLTNAGAWMLSMAKRDSEEMKISYTSAAETVEEIADEGMVLLLNNDNLLPLPENSKLNVFGMRSTQLVYTGGGSVAADSTKAIRLEDALRDVGGFELNDELLYLYYNYYKNGKISTKEVAAPGNKSESEFIEGASINVLPEVPSDAFFDASVTTSGKNVIENAKEFSDVAVITISRAGSESADYSPRELQLSEEERALVEDVTSNFDNVILLLNSAHTIELGFVEEFPQIKSVILMSYPGEAGANTVAKILNGSVNPSGRLSDTYLYNNLDHPAANNFNELLEDGTWNRNGYSYADQPQVDNIPFMVTIGLPKTAAVGYTQHYAEGIYVGYRYFETRHDTDDTFNYDEVVQFPFGYGLSYTTFEQNIVDFDENNGEISVRVSVKNTGDVAGKDVVQIYYNPPYTGKIEKSTANLVSFMKSNEIQPGDTEIYTLTFDVEDMASYDYVTNKAYVLEKGNYEIMLKENSHDLIASETYKVKDDIIYNDENDGKRESDLVVATNQFDDASFHIDEYLTRDWEETSRAFTGPKESDYVITDEIYDALVFEKETDEELGVAGQAIPEYGVVLSETIKLSDMKDVPLDDPKWDEFISQLTLDELIETVVEGAYVTNQIDRLGVPMSKTPDGALSLGAHAYSGPVMGNNNAGVIYPSPSLIACTFNPNMAQLQGESVANEALALGYNGWYAPAMNIHRTPFDGRIAEYYSEDPVLSGVMASNVIGACTENGVWATAKHFALHDRQSNAREEMLKFVNEQAFREIYLKPFEMSVKDGNAFGVMSAFDYIGLDWIGADDGLLTNVLRNEWGFNGVVITDAASYPHMDIVRMMNHSGDLYLAGQVFLAADRTPFNQLKEYAADPETEVSTIISLQRASKNVMYMVSRTYFVE